MQRLFLRVFPLPLNWIWFSYPAVAKMRSLIFVVWLVTVQSASIDNLDPLSDAFIRRVNADAESWEVSPSVYFRFVRGVYKICISCYRGCALKTVGISKFSIYLNISKDSPELNKCKPPLATPREKWDYMLSSFKHRNKNEIQKSPDNHENPIALSFKANFMTIQWIHA